MAFIPKQIWIWKWQHGMQNIEVLRPLFDFLMVNRLVHLTDLVRPRVACNILNKLDLERLAQIPFRICSRLELSLFAHL